METRYRMKSRIPGQPRAASPVEAERKFAGWVDVDRPFASPGVRTSDFRGGTKTAKAPVANVVIAARTDLLRNQLREEYARLLVV